MATLATRAVVGLIGVKLNTLYSKPNSSFLGKKLNLKTISESSGQRKFSTLRSKNLVVFASGGQVFNFVHDLFLGVRVGLPCTVMECGDIIYRSTLPRSDGITVNIVGVILALGTLSYLLVWMVIFLRKIAIHISSEYGRRVEVVVEVALPWCFSVKR
ncbi:serine threonine- kinase STN7, chloroplastic [Olea europaea subsp. europaea]|uniref:Serine threonine- kinase STN7, chloroplastic n=1 Tax=Olea europaea subsp. europaea TaxID=158383 RepID=A0A8S0Q342_OLEEU|nr:serine threonine- kinase STN7, chloroplastic [Olea europaea subsp. europaea]